MVVGQCPRCSTPYTAAAVTAYGVLRPRRAHKGGPYVLYACESCGRQIRLVPHGHGRYAPPGEPPPPPVPEDARRPPWVHHEAPPREAPRETVDPPPASTPDEAPPVGIGAAVLRAYETLGLEPGATRVQIAQAFRARSKTCHPDKVAQMDEDIQALASAKFRALREAYEFLIS